MEHKENLSRRKISRVLISVSDKSGIVDLSKGLSENGIEIVSTGGTSKAISEAGIPVRPVEEVTNFPEMMGGRVKTLHPLIFGGILGRDSDKDQMKEHGIENIDMVICNLYPFKSAAEKGVDLSSLIEEIDIGGPSLLRAASKNHSRVSVVTDPGDYGWILNEILNGGLTFEQRQQLALKSFRHTAEYDSIIQSVLAQRFGEEELPSSLHLTGIGSPPLRYGENPHQSSVFYSDLLHSAPSVANSEQLQGKQLSYNNLLDFDAALAIVMEFDDPTAVIVKHNNPCGVASSETLLEAFNDAMKTDPQSAFGGIISFNREVNASLAKEIISSFKEGIIAPSYSKEALDIFSSKDNLRILETGSLDDYHRSPSLRSLDGGWLLQEADEVLSLIHI